MNLNPFSIFTIVITGLLIFSGCAKKKGCTDLTATNYNASAEENDGSCIYPITDIDGNVYHEVTIGSQVWMVENLKTTKYRNGDAIPGVGDNTQWSNLSTVGAYCYYNNDQGYVSTYGMFYNWYAVNDSRNIAPEGWHIPSYAEWSTLITHLGSSVVAGGAMKSITGWGSPNTGANNSSGFSALPGGLRNGYGEFDAIGVGTYFWSSTASNSSEAWGLNLSSGDSYALLGTHGDPRGYSCRCIKD